MRRGKWQRERRRRGEWKRRRPGGSKAARRPPQRSLPPPPGTNIAEELKRGQTKLVQVIKKPSYQGPRVTAQVSPRRPVPRLHAVASKSASRARSKRRDQRAKLREMVTKLVRPIGRLIIRTVADD